MTAKHVKKPRSFFLAAFPLFLVLFIDSMGLGLVFPILNALVVEPSSTFIDASTSTAMRNFIYGSTVATFMFCWFFGAAFLGDLSDQVGRKKSLMICLVGSFFGYLLSALSVVMSSLTILLIGRIIAGFTAGSQSIAQAAIVDLSPEEHKAKNLGLMLFVMSIGFVFGPLAGGLLSDQDISPYFTFSVPFYFAAGISLINMILLKLFFKETFVVSEKITLKLHKAISIFISAFTNKKIRRLSIIFMVMVSGWSGFYSFVSMFLLHIFKFSSLNVSLYMGVLGAGFGIGTGLLIEPFTNRFTLKRCFIGSAFLASVGILITALAINVKLIWLMAIPVGAMAAMAYSIMLTIFSNQVDEDAQGWIMGVTGAIMALSFALNALIVGEFASYDVHIPILIASAGLFFAALLMTLIYKGDGSGGK